MRRRFATRAPWWMGAVAVVAMLNLAACSDDPMSVAVHGPVPISLVSRYGPVEPAGPFAALTMADLQTQLTAAGGPRGILCPYGPCWRGSHARPGSLYIAFNPSDTDACFLVRALTTAVPAPRRLRIDVTVKNECTGEPTRPRGRDNLLAVPLRALSAGQWTIVMRERTPSTAYDDAGQTVVTIPARH